MSGLTVEYEESDKPWDPDEVNPSYGVAVIRIGDFEVKRIEITQYMDLYPNRRQAQDAADEAAADWLANRLGGA